MRKMKEIFYDTKIINKESNHPSVPCFQSPPPPHPQLHNKVIWGLIQNNSWPTIAHGEAQCILTTGIKIKFVFFFLPSTSPPLPLIKCNLE